MNKYTSPRVETKWQSGPNHIPPGNAAPRRIEQPPHNWNGSVFIALIIVALLLLGLSLDVQATVDAVNEGIANETE